MNNPKSLNPHAKLFTPSTFKSVNNTRKNVNKNKLKNTSSSTKPLNPHAKLFNVPKRFNNTTVRNNNKNIRNEPYYLPSMDLMKYVAIDCEMVGVGPRKQSALAEVSLVDFNGKVIYHKYVKPSQPITNYRTFVSGITPDILEREGVSYSEVKRELESILQDKILVGHGLQNDINAIGIPIPKSRRWDSTEIPLFMRRPEWGGPLQPKKLKVLLKNYVGNNIQTGKHSASEDAEASMKLFKWYLVNVVMKQLTK